MVQARFVQHLVESIGGEVEIVTVTTSGDRGDRTRLGAFVGEIQQSLLRGDIDIALHCLKDLPTQRPQNLSLATFLAREDPRDALISLGPTLQELPEGAVVGTGALRRTSQLARLRPDLKFKPLVGNVDSRLRQVLNGNYDAIVLAMAGLLRLRQHDPAGSEEFSGLTIHPFSVSELVPAAGQACLVLETRSDRADIGTFLEVLHCEQTKLAVSSERAFLGEFGTGCSLPVAAYAVVEGEHVSLTARVTNTLGTETIEETRSEPTSASLLLGKSMAQDFVARGALRLLPDESSTTGEPKS